MLYNLFLIAFAAIPLPVFCVLAKMFGLSTGILLIFYIHWGIASAWLARKYYDDDSPFYEDWQRWAWIISCFLFPPLLSFLVLASIIDGFYGYFLMAFAIIPLPAFYILVERFGFPREPLFILYIFWGMASAWLARKYYEDDSPFSIINELHRWLWTIGCLLFPPLLFFLVLASKIYRRFFWIPPTPEERANALSSPAKQPAPRKEEHKMEYGDLRCVHCRTIYVASLTLLDPREVRVACCNVCPVNAVFAVCANCVNLEEISKINCPSCGAAHQWKISGKVPKYS